MTATRNHRTRSKNLLSLFAVEPKIPVLANALGLRLLWRDGVAWADDVQLTAPYIHEDGKARPRRTSEKDRAEMALGILTKIKKARDDWGTLLQRAESIIDDFETNVVKGCGTKRMHWSVWRNDSLDSVSVFGGGFGPDCGGEVTLELVGEQRIQVKGESLADSVRLLREEARKQLAGKPTSGTCGAGHTADSEFNQLLGK